ncbi:MAG: hypothetical protein INR65_04480 [Gluconacetobacter diazotrophicus]|nr:hypothetical protein [Gluconacetobacter diazotrophicus]
MPARCPLCGNPDFHRRDGGRECTHCGLPVPDGRDAEAVLDELRAALAAGEVRVGHGWRAGSLRDAAWSLGFTLRFDDPARVARAEAVVEAAPGGIVVAVMTRLDQLGGALEMLRQAHGFRGAAVLLDAAGGEPDGNPSPGLWGVPVPIRVAAHPLGTDYAAQRNRLQVLAERSFGEGWVLQLDSDERMTPGMLRSLGWLAADAERHGLLSLGLPRRNLVEGELSALFPDIQYRLNRSGVRFNNAVHERPVVPFEQTALALCAPIEHLLFRRRVLERTIQYEGIEPGQGRPQDEAALSAPFAEGPLPVAALAAGEPARGRTAKAA